MNFSILIVDDNKAARDSLDMILEPEGYELHFCEDGLRAIEFVKENRPDLVLLDLMMPEVDGYEVCRNIRMDGNIGDIPVIIITAIDDRDTTLRGIRAGADDIISKPIDRTELRLKVQHIASLNRYRNASNARDRFTWLASQTSNAVAIVDESDTILFANSTAKHYLSKGDESGNRTFIDAVTKRFIFEQPELWQAWPGKVPGDGETRLYLRPKVPNAELPERLEAHILTQHEDETRYLVLLKPVNV